MSRRDSLGVKEGKARGCVLAWSIRKGFLSHREEIYQRIEAEEKIPAVSY
ncbi:hypothetical protein KCP77_07565 [Salmonella enterica subsp. enterica]|nr:hypothetical protein KCP77_07565 [Salmonella enterica subsp. enterica]